MLFLSAAYYDGEKPVPVKGIIRESGPVLYFDPDGGGDRITFRRSDIRECRRNNGRVIISIGKESSTGTAAPHFVSDDLSAY
ncbi:MAG: hypothetical protein ACRCUT_00210, partial [Spirochaetota bacterium]